MTATTMEARKTATATSRAKSLVGVVGTAVLVSICGCAGLNQAPSTAHADTSAFAWFREGPAPAGWKTMALPDATAELSIPPEATPAPSDPGSISAEVRSPDGGLLVYLNATPKQGDESLATWPEFRLAHLADENGQPATPIDSRTGMAFRGGTGSCVADVYQTRVGAHRYRELACYVEGARGGSVLVAATPADSWNTYAPLLEQAVDSYRAE